MTPATTTPVSATASPEVDSRFRLGLFGDTRSGKTVYLTALRWLAEEGPMPPGVNLRADASSARYLGERVASVRAGQWPAATIDDNVVNLLIDHDHRTILVRTTDFRGGEFADEFYEKQRSEFVRRLFAKCSAYVFLVDPGELKPVEKGQNQVEGQESRQRRTMAVEASLEILRQQAHGITRFHHPVAVVFTKCDLHPSVAADPDAFAQQYMKPTYEYLRQRAKWFRFFASSSTGPLNGSLDRPPQPLKPEGIYEPLLWCMESSRRHRKWLLGTAIIIVVVLIALGYGWLYKSQGTELSAIRAVISQSNPQQLHDLYLRARAVESGTRYALTHPSERRRIVVAIIDKADEVLSGELTNRRSGNRDLRTIQDYEAAQSLIGRFADDYPGTEPTLRWSDWLKRQREVLANGMLDRLEALAKGGNESEFNRLTTGEYLKVATPKADDEIRKLEKNILWPRVLLTDLREMYSVAVPSELQKIDEVRAKCRNCEDTLSRHPLAGQCPEVEYLHIVRRVFDSLASRPNELVAVKIETQYANKIKFKVSDDEFFYETPDWVPLSGTGVANWYGATCTFKIPLRMIVYPKQAGCRVVQDTWWRDNNWGGDATAAIISFVRNREYSLGQGSFWGGGCILKCTGDEGSATEPKGWRRVRQFLDDVDRMRELEDELFKKHHD